MKKTTQFWMTVYRGLKRYSLAMLLTTGLISLSLSPSAFAQSDDEDLEYDEAIPLVIRGITGFEVVPSKTPTVGDTVILTLDVNFGNDCRINFSEVPLITNREIVDSIVNIKFFAGYKLKYLKECEERHLPRNRQIKIDYTPIFKSGAKTEVINFDVFGGAKFTWYKAQLILILDPVQKNILGYQIPIKRYNQIVSTENTPARIVEDISLLYKTIVALPRSGFTGETPEDTAQAKEIYEDLALGINLVVSRNEIGERGLLIKTKKNKAQLFFPFSKLKHEGRNYMVDEYELSSLTTKKDGVTTTKTTVAKLKFEARQNYSPWLLSELREELITKEIPPSMFISVDEITVESKDGRTISRKETKSAYANFELKK